MKFKDTKYGDLSGQDITMRRLMLVAEELDSLEGSPDILRGFFEMSYNKLVNLKFSPKEIYGDAWFQDNLLESLECDLVMVDGDLNISHNPIKTFKGSLRKITGDLVARNLPEFSSFEEIENELIEANIVVGRDIVTDFGRFKQDSTKFEEYNNRYRISILQKFL